MAAIMALVGGSSAVSFDVNFRPEAPAAVAEKYANKIGDFVDDNMEDINPVIGAFKGPVEEYFIRAQATEEQRIQNVINMVTLLKDTFLPDVNTCDSEGLAECLLSMDNGVDFDRWDWNSNIFETPCGVSNGCQDVLINNDQQAANQNGDYFEGNATAIEDSVNRLNVQAFQSLQQNLASVNENIQELNDELVEELQDINVARDLGCLNSCLDSAINDAYRGKADRIFENIIAYQCCNALNIVSITDIQENAVIPTD